MIPRGARVRARRYGVGNITTGSKWLASEIERLAALGADGWLA